MPKHKAANLRESSLDELKHKLGALDKELFELKAKRIIGQLDKPHLFKATRRQRAQVSTIMREMQNG